MGLSEEERAALIAYKLAKSKETLAEAVGIAIR